MTDRGIIFSAPMVLALLAGKKRQTRRLATSPLRRAQIGDRLWVREAWRTWRDFDKVRPIHLPGGSPAFYEADRDNADRHGKYRPGMHMPRWASRLTLIVTDVRTEPLDDISGADALAEGIPWAEDRTIHVPGDEMDARQRFRDLWDSLHDKPGERWADSPTIVALTFRVECSNIDRPAP